MDEFYLRSLFFVSTDWLIKKNPVARLLLRLRGIKDVDKAVDAMTEEYLAYIMAFLPKKKEDDNEKS